MHLEVPGDGKKVLLHCCCAPCSGAVVECLVQNGIRPALFFSNSNIVPFEEYEKRRGELVRYAQQFGLEVIDDEYDHGAWLDFVLERGIPGQAGNDAKGDGNDAKGDGDTSAVMPDLIGHLEAEPERGARCLNCFKFRLMRAAQYAAAHGYDTLTTTLASSRWKSLEQVDEAGRWAFGEMPDQVGHDEREVGHEVIWWGQNWRRGGLQPRRAEIIKEQCFYNQTYCGCEFSERHDKE
ncbi:MAG: epoxyqueuosine reductase QueH [Bacteroidales bacterium]|nr:epoxyqueuosine reductase QueH [Bacteroidales bacterium]